MCERRHGFSFKLTPPIDSHYKYLMAYQTAHSNSTTVRLATTEKISDWSIVDGIRRETLGWISRKFTVH